jgi:hypothetical protein
VAAYSRAVYVCSYDAEPGGFGHDLTNTPRRYGELVGEPGSRNERNTGRVCIEVAGGEYVNLCQC